MADHARPQQQRKPRKRRRTKRKKKRPRSREKYPPFMESSQNGDYYASSFFRNGLIYFSVPKSSLEMLAV